MGRYLGIDCSTEGLSAVIIDTIEGQMLYQHQLVYERELPQYQDSRGALHSAHDPLERHANPQLWAAALERLFQDISKDDFNLSTLNGICCSAQQHGTVYLNRQFLRQGITPAQGEELAQALPALLALPTAPLWMDLSTFDECLELSHHLKGGNGAWAERTGSVPCGCYAAAQIRKLYRRDPAGYERTAVIHLISSFMGSLLTGRSVPVDDADASGMNLLNLSTRQWDPLALSATAPELLQRLPAVLPSGSIVGHISEYLSDKYHLRPETDIIIGTGGGLSRMIGLGVWRPGAAAISLKTCDAYFASVKKPVPLDEEGYGHLFLHAGEGYVAQSFFQNGGIARRTVRDRYHLDWADFDDRAIQVTPPGNNGNIMLPYFTAESTPLVLNGGPVLSGRELFTNWQDGVGLVRAVVEAQAMSMYIHTEWIGKRPKRIRLTGSAGRRRGLAQIYADVFNATIERIAIHDAGALGSAIRAAHVVEGTPYSLLSETFSNSEEDLALTPVRDHVAIYRQLLERYRQLERSNA